MYAPVRTVAPTVTPITLAETKVHLRVDSSDEDDLVTGLIDAATAHLDGWSGILGRALIEQTWRQDFDDFTARMALPLGPAMSVGSITYYDGANTQQTLSASYYRLLTDELGPYVARLPDLSYPSVTSSRDAAVSVTYTAGFAASESNMPPSIRQAMLLFVGHLYRNREAVVAGSFSDLPLGVQSLLAPYRRGYV
jgi:uncharacterized phiE125 gp8 family phage protein